MKLRWQDWSWPTWLPFHRWKVVVKVEAADEIPETLPRRGAAIVSSGGRTKWIAFDCPCGSGHRIVLNLDSGRKPAWKLLDKPERRLTIKPSVDYKTAGKRCHYFIRNGRVDWV